MDIKIGTRGSKLALAQANYVLDTLKSSFPDNNYEIVVIKTTGDLDQNRPLDAIGSKGIFTDEIEDALLSGRIQLAVHSMKDMPDTLKEGLVFAEPWDREDARDVLILNQLFCRRASFYSVLCTISWADTPCTFSVLQS